MKRAQHPNGSGTRNAPHHTGDASQGAGTAPQRTACSSEPARVPPTPLSWADVPPPEVPLPNPPANVAAVGGLDDGVAQRHWQAMEDDLRRAHGLLKRRILDDLQRGRTPRHVSVSELARLAGRGRTAVYQHHAHWVRRIDRTKAAIVRLMERQARERTRRAAETPRALKARIGALERALRAAQRVRASKELAALVGIVSDRRTEQLTREAMDLRQQFEEAARERDELRERCDALSRAMVELTLVQHAPPAGSAGLPSAERLPESEWTPEAPWALGPSAPGAPSRGKDRRFRQR